MNLEQRLNESFDDILRTSGYFFEVLNSNKRQSNIITGPNNQLIPPPIRNQLAHNIAHFEKILDETMFKFNSASWCVEQIVRNKVKEDEQLQEELERQKKAQAERKRKEEEEARAKEEERLARERRQSEQSSQLTQSQSQNAPSSGPNDQLAQNNQEMDKLNDDMDFDMDLSKTLDIPNPSEILSSITYKNGDENVNFDMNMLKDGQGLDDLNMDILGQEMGGGLGGEDDFDVDTFLNQFEGGD